MILLEKQPEYRAISNEIFETANLVRIGWDFSKTICRDDVNKDAILSTVEIAMLKGSQACWNHVDVSESAASQKLTDRMEYLKSIGIPADMHMSDGTIRLFYTIITNTEKNAKNINLDLQIRELTSQVAASIKGSTDIKPHGFSRDQIHLINDPLYANDQILLRAQLRQQFKGLDVPTDRSAGIVASTSLLSVLRDAQNGMSPHKSLLNALFHQGFKVQAYNNLVDFNREIMEIDTKRPFHNTAYEINSRRVADVIGDSASVIPTPINKNLVQHLNPLTVKNNIKSEPTR